MASSSVERRSGVFFGQTFPLPSIQLTDSSLFGLCLVFCVATIDSNMSSILCPSTDKERSLAVFGRTRLRRRDSSYPPPRHQSSSFTADLGDRLLILNLLLLLNLFFLNLPVVRWYRPSFSKRLS